MKFTDNFMNLLKKFTACAEWRWIATEVAVVARRACMKRRQEFDGSMGDGVVLVHGQSKYDVLAASVSERAPRATTRRKRADTTRSLTVAASTLSNLNGTTAGVAFRRRDRDVSSYAKGLAQKKQDT